MLPIAKALRAIMKMPTAEDWRAAVPDVALSLEESVVNHSRMLLSQIQSMVYRGAHDTKGDFSLLEVASSDFYRYSSYERALTAHIRDLLVNPVLSDLFQFHGYRSKQIELVNFPGRRNEGFEDAAGIELVIDTEAGRVGIRYTDFAYRDQTLLDAVANLQLGTVLIVDWSDQPRRRLLDHSVDSKNEFFAVEYVTVRGLFARFFSEAEYEIFLSGMRKAVSRANDIIGMGAITRLTLNRMSSLRGEILDSIRAERESGSKYAFTPKEAPRLPFGSLSDREEATLDRAYYDDGLCYALVGSSDFARCFVTAEYLRKALAQGGAFDCTPIVCGYLKAIEQLAYALMRYRLSSSNRDGLFIKKKLGRNPVVGKAEGKRPFRMGKSEHVIFTPENEDCFDTSLGSLANFLNDDGKGWKLSKDGRHYVLWVLRQYAKDCRNGHFHKDNIESFEEVERIRGNTLHAARLLLGGYAGAGTSIPLSDWLGVDSRAVEYDRLFTLMEEMPRSCRRFKIKFADGAPQYVERAFERPLMEHDDLGHIVTPLLFSTVDPRSEPTSERRNLCISKSNMPEQIWFIRGDGEEKALL